MTYFNDYFFSVIANKAGSCPETNGYSYLCDTECQNDASCDGALKCCYNGCGYSCVSPIEDGYVPELTTTALGMMILLSFCGRKFKLNFT